MSFSIVNSVLGRRDERRPLVSSPQRSCLPENEINRLPGYDWVSLTSLPKLGMRLQAQRQSTGQISMRSCDHVLSELTAIHIHPAPEISQHQTAEAEPPAYRGNEKVVMMVANNPLILTAKENVDKYPNSLLKTGLYPNCAAS